MPQPKKNLGKTTLGLFLVLALGGCNLDFDPASLIEEQRFLAIIADPLESAPGETVSFSAVMTNKDGTLYEGPFAWLIVEGDGLQEGETDESDVNPDDLSFTENDEPFLWEVPAEADLAARFGPAQKNGRLLTVAAIGFKNGDVEDKTILAYKLFIVSDRPAAARFANPTIAAVSVFTPGGVELEPNQEGEYETTSAKLDLKAEPEKDDGDLTYHWFSTSEDWEPDFDDEGSQTFKAEGKGAFGIYLVLRHSFYFTGDNGGRSRLTGIDTWHTRIKVQ